MVILQKESPQNGDSLYSNFDSAVT